MLVNGAGQLRNARIPASLAFGASNHFTYVRNDPVNATDPSGHAGMPTTNPVDIGNALPAGVGTGGALVTSWGTYLTRWADPQFSPLQSGFTVGGTIDSPGLAVWGESRSTMYVPASEHWMGADWNARPDYYRLYYVDEAQIGSVVERSAILRSYRQLALEGRVPRSSPEIWKDAQLTNLAEGDSWYRRLFRQTGEAEVLMKGPVPAGAVRSAWSVWGERGLYGGSRALLAYGAYQSGRRIYTAYGVAEHSGNYDVVVNTVTGEAGGWAGAYAVGEVGAIYGGAFFGPLGAAIGGIGGGIVGYAGGQQIGAHLQSYFQGGYDFAHANVHPIPGSIASDIPRARWDMGLFTTGQLRSLAASGNPEFQLKYIETQFGTNSSDAIHFRKYMQQANDWHPPFVVPQMSQHLRDILRDGAGLQ